MVYSKLNVLKIIIQGACLVQHSLHQHEIPENKD